MMKRTKILLVDDHVENLIALERSMDDMNLDFIRALSGNEALIATLEHKFALALIDVQMPEMDGFETVKLMRKDKQTEYLPVIFVSAIYTDEYYHIKGLESGAVDFLTKPINIKILRGKVAVFLRLYKQRKELEEALENVKTLQGMLPICSICKNIRDDEGYWSKVEEYIQKHSDAEFTHSLCPDCVKKHYPEFSKNKP